MDDGGGLRVLIVEDEALIAMLAEDMLDGLGHRVAGVATTLDEAQAMAASDGFDCALLDVNLGGTSAVPVAHALRARGVPFAFTTGYGGDGVDGFGDAPVLPKPYAMADLEAVMARLRAACA